MYICYLFPVLFVIIGCLICVFICFASLPPPTFFLLSVFDVCGFTPPPSYASGARQKNIAK